MRDENRSLRLLFVPLGALLPLLVLGVILPAILERDVVRPIQYLPVSSVVVRTMLGLLPFTGSPGIMHWFLWNWAIWAVIGGGVGYGVGRLIFRGPKESDEEPAEEKGR